MNCKTTFVFLLICTVSALIEACGTSAVTDSPAEAKVESTASKDAEDLQRSGRPETDRIDFPNYEEIRRRYRQNSEEFDRLALQLETDLEITELYCDENMVVVTTRDETFYDGDDDPYTSKYIPLCRFTSKVTALRNTKGIRFPHRFFEVGPLFVTNFLEKRNTLANSYDECGSNLFDGDRGACEIAINENWSATYEWRPFCLEHMKGQVGC